jgi:hypothetical protein
MSNRLTYAPPPCVNVLRAPYLWFFSSWGGFANLYAFNADIKPILSPYFLSCGHDSRPALDLQEIVPYRSCTVIKRVTLPQVAGILNLRPLPDMRNDPFFRSNTASSLISVKRTYRARYQSSGIVTCHRVIFESRSSSSIINRQTVKKAFTASDPRQRRAYFE